MPPLTAALLPGLLKLTFPSTSQSPAVSEIDVTFTVEEAKETALPVATQALRFLADAAGRRVRGSRRSK